MTTTDSLLLFQVGPVPCCVVSDSVQIIIDPPPHITAIPGSNAFRPGLIVHAKKVVSVYDVRTKFNLSTEQRGKIIIAKMSNRLFGFWVDSIQSVILSSEGKFQILPAECPKELFESLFILNDQLIFKTNFDAITKAQVNTQIQLFIDKLTNDKEKKAKTTPSNTKSTTTTEAKHNQKVQIHKTSTELTNKTSATKTHTKKNTIDSIKQTSVKRTVSQPEKNNTKTSNLTSHNFSKNKAPTSTRMPSIKNTKLNTSNQTLNNSLKERSISRTHTATYSSEFKKESPTPSYKTNIETDNFKSKKSNTVIDSPTSTPARKDESPKQAFSFISILILFLITIIPMAAWLLWSDSTTNDKRVKIETLQNKIRVEIPFEAPPVSELKPDLEPEPVFVPDSNNNETVLTLINKDTDKETHVPNTDNTLSTDDKDELSDITIDNETIVITLNDSDGEFNEKKIIPNDEIQSVTLNETTATVSTSLSNEETNHLDKAESIDISISPIDNQITQNKDITGSTEDTSNKIIHTIVKGDTLWHIAKRYINNPYKYPQLAKLSNIKNPDLIYPGNRVIIIIKKSKTKRP